MSTDINDLSAGCITCHTDTRGTAAVARCSESCTIVILGATGDLTHRKLMPALFRLHRSGRLPQRYAIVGCGRTHLDDASFRGKMQTLLHAGTEAPAEDVRKFLQTLFYRQVLLDDHRTFFQLADFLAGLDARNGDAGNRLFYLALPPGSYGTAVRCIGESGLPAESAGGRQWSRIVVEKPFGHDLASALQLDREIHNYFDEHQVYRIDHYLAKETVQNVLMFRFANAIFEPIWNRRYIDAVHIKALENLGIEHRAGYYEQAGVVRDMFQNHMMQLLALTGMEPPADFSAEPVRDEKVKLYRSLRPFPTDRLDAHLVLGQYSEGKSGEQTLPAYRAEPGVNSRSMTPTYAMMKIFIDNWRWQGVPFYLTSGKRLREKRTEIVIDFKPVPHSMFRGIFGEKDLANRLTLGVYPEERISLTFRTKTPGARIDLRTVTMDFHYYMGYDGEILDAYDRVLLDCMLGDQTLFWRQDGVEACWSFLTPILVSCEQCGDPSALLHFYPAASDGPSAARHL